MKTNEIIFQLVKSFFHSQGRKPAIIVMDYKNYGKYIDENMIHRNLSTDFIYSEQGIRVISSVNVSEITLF